MTVRTRIAPSPTGDPHVGTAYVALFNYALARKHGGQFVLRIEDTDRAAQPSRPASAMIFEALRWLGLDVGRGAGRRRAARRPTARASAPRSTASTPRSWCSRGAAYPCFCTRERLDGAARGAEGGRSSTSATTAAAGRSTPAEAARRRGGRRGARRPPGHAARTTPMVVHRPAARRGRASSGAQMDDQVLLKSDGFPTYHLANVVDDHLMGITPRDPGRGVALVAAQARAALPGASAGSRRSSATCRCCATPTSRRSRSARTRSA